MSGAILVATVLIQTSPKLFLIFGSLCVFLLLWSILIAVFDVISITMFYKRSRHWDEAQRAKIQYELEQRQKEMQENDHNEGTKEP